MAVYCSKTKWLGAGGSQDFCHFATTMSEARARLKVQQSATKCSAMKLSKQVSTMQCNKVLQSATKCNAVQLNTFLVSFSCALQKHRVNA